MLQPKKGDVLEWKTINGLCQGIVTESENGELIIRVDDHTAFRLKDISSFKRKQSTLPAQSLESNRNGSKYI
jgi:hypothetical protein